MKTTTLVLQGWRLALALVVVCLCAKNARGDVCVTSVQSIQVQCQSGCDKNGCDCFFKGTIRMLSGLYGIGELWSMVDDKCCGSPMSHLGTDLRQACQIGAPTRQPAAARLVFIRGCDGRFRLFEVSA